MKMNIEKLLRLKQELFHRIHGQEEALARLWQAVARRELDAAPQHGPPGCYLLAGPTGVGKTLTALTLAEVLFGRHQFLRIDCSEYEAPDSLKTLLGDRAEDRGQLGCAYDESPEGVWLWDEIEKAHPKIPKLFLQMGDAARLTLTCGETLDLSRIYQIITTNLGSAEIIDREHLTFTSLEKHVVGCIEQYFRPELLGRFGHPFVFRPLSRDTQAGIAEQRLDEVIQWHMEKGRRIQRHPDVLPFLIHRGFSRRLGARTLVAFIRNSIGDAVAENILAGGNGSGLLVVEGGKLKLIPAP